MEKFLLSILFHSAIQYNTVYFLNGKVPIKYYYSYKFIIESYYNFKVKKKPDPLLFQATSLTITVS